jgi:Calponin family repeat
MIGPKMATENKRNFTEEQILQGRNAQIGLQAGSNKGASQVNTEIKKNISVVTKSLKNPQLAILCIYEYYCITRPRIYGFVLQVG